MFPTYSSQFRSNLVAEAVAPGSLEMPALSPHDAAPCTRQARMQSENIVVDDWSIWLHKPFTKRYVAKCGSSTTLFAEEFDGSGLRTQNIPSGS